MIFMGIDWAEDHHDVCIVDDQGQRRLTQCRPRVSSSWESGGPGGWQATRGHGRCYARTPTLHAVPHPAMLVAAVGDQLEPRIPPGNLMSGWSLLSRLLSRDGIATIVLRALRHKRSSAVVRAGRFELPRVLPTRT